MKTHNVAEEKAKLLEKEALLLLPKDKQNVQQGKKIMSIKQWLVGDTEINMLETDTVCSAFMLAQKWPLELMKGQKRIIFAFMAGNDVAVKGKSLTDTKTPKSLMNLMLLFGTEQKEQPYLSMLVANSLIESLRGELGRKSCESNLQIRWKHDVLLESQKLGQISFKHAHVEGQFYTQLNVEVNVKSIPKNFGAYDFQPTYLEKHLKGEVDLGWLAEIILSNLARDLGDQKSAFQRKSQIQQAYSKELIYLGQKVTIYDRTYEHIHHTGKFLGVDELGNALLDDFKQPFTDGVMKYCSEAKDYISLFRADY